ncbi:MAG: CehA/McbA family metallohydrolase [Deltaproteobacteria bacterium]|nr:CehA/McbA family metallohydrolase [Deltaproteobacteria bacterium]
MRGFCRNVAILFMLGMIASAAACGGDDDDNDGPPTDDDSADDDSAADDLTDDDIGDDDDDTDRDDDSADDDTGDDDTGPYPSDYCAYFLTGEVDLEGDDADGDGVPNGWDHCPNNPDEWLDSDRDGVGNFSDPDIDGDGIPNDEDSDRDGDAFDNGDEDDAGTDPDDPSSIPGLPRFDLDLGILNPEPGWYRGDLHIHTEYSHDSIAKLAWYFPMAEAAGFDFLWITDHRVFDAPFDPAWDQSELLLVPGIEWGGPGHANMGGIRTDNTAVYEDADDVRRAWRVAKLQGAVQSLNHYGSDMDYWDALFDEAPDLFDLLDVIEAWNVIWPFNGATNLPSVALWEQLLSDGYRIGAVGGGDTHYVPAMHVSPTTVVWANSLSVPGILDGIRRGRTYITQADLLTFHGRPELEFRADADGDGEFEAMLGDEVAAGPITLRIEILNAKGPVVLIRNGAEFARFTDHAPGEDVTYTAEDDASAGDWYRVEMRENGLPFSPMRLLSSAIYVAAE